MKNLLIDNHKLLYHETELKKALVGEPIAPIYVDLGIHNACNYRCVHCGPGFRGHGGLHIKFDDEHKKEYNKCFGLPYIWQVDGDGGVYACGSFLQEDKYCYGNINEQSFRDIVKSQHTCSVMKYAENMPDFKYCDTHCRPHTINKFLWTLKHHSDGENFLAEAIEQTKKRNKPNHINFI